MEPGDISGFGWDGLDAYGVEPGDAVIFRVGAASFGAGD